MLCCTKEIHYVFFAENLKDKEIMQVKTKKTSNRCCAKLPWMLKLEQQLEELQRILLITSGIHSFQCPIFANVPVQLIFRLIISQAE